MKRKLLKCLNIMSASVLIAGTLANEVALADVQGYVDQEEGVITSVVSDAEYDGWKLQWRYEKDFYDLLTGISKQEENIAYAYDENYNRIQKRYGSKETVDYTYNEQGNLIEEKSGDDVIQYVYASDEETSSEKIIGFICEGEEYTYKFTDCVITEILRGEEEIARYVYDGKINTDVLECIEGEWISNTEDSFIGNINKIRYKGYYYDVETGWYYHGRYIDPECNRFIDGLNRRDVTNMISEYGEEYEAEILLASNFFGMDMSEEEETNSLARSDVYSELEVIARVIYAESSYDLIDEGGVAWVIYNRSIAHSISAYKVVTAVGTDGAYDFGGYRSDDYYNPGTSDVTWSYAVTHGSLLSRGYKPNITPSGFSSQKNFRSVGSFQGKLTWTGGTFYYNGDRIYDIYVVGYGVVTSYNLLSSSEITNLNNKYNIFFKFWYE